MVSFVDMSVRLMIVLLIVHQLQVTGQAIMNGTHFMNFPIIYNDTDWLTMCQTENLPTTDQPPSYTSTDNAPDATSKPSPLSTDASPSHELDATSEASTAQHTTRSPTNTTSPLPVFMPPPCDGSQIGMDCNTSATTCDIFKPCRNDGTCHNNNSIALGYTCLCMDGFNGSNCENDIRLCKPDTCQNNGNCTEVLNTTFPCSCGKGWTGLRCETKVNHCNNVTCLNGGVCRSLFLHFTCECLGISYSGRFCEITSKQTVVYETVSKSFGYIAILSMSIVALFVVVMDMLKYGFGIDPAEDELEIIRRTNRLKKTKRRPVVQRFTYVNHPPPTTINH